jgi:CheY-like chemotaxis protein
MSLEKTAAQKVLIVDNDQATVKAIAANLNRAGYKTLEASDGEEAVAVVHKEKPDLIVLNLNFPPDSNGVSWDGYGIMEWLRGAKESRTIPIITMTGIPETLDMERNLDLGAVGFLFKPLDYDKLLKLAYRVLGSGVTVAA